jgi:hypothetical protein
MMDFALLTATSGYHRFYNIDVESPILASLSASYFEKGRILCNGPSFLRFESGKRSGKILYRWLDVESWLSDQQCEPKGEANA